MSIYLDSAFPEEAGLAFDLGFVRGITTNPALLAKVGRPIDEVLPALCHICTGTVFYQLTAPTLEERRAEAERILALNEDLADEEQQENAGQFGDWSAQDGAEGLLARNDLFDGQELQERELLDSELLDEDEKEEDEDADLYYYRLGRIGLKIPASTENMALVSEFSDVGVSVAVTALFSLPQAYLACEAGANFVLPYVNRTTRLRGDGLGFVRQLRQVCEAVGRGTEVLAASIKSPDEAVQTLLAGAQHVSAPWAVLQAMGHDPLSDEAVAEFARAMQAIRS
jgi:transaldolase